MSAISASASSILLAPVFTRNPSRRDTHSRSKTASMATMPSNSALIGARSRSSSTPEVRAASRALAEMGSQPPNTRSSSEARGTKSRMSGLRPSPRLPRRMCAICETDPIGASPDRRAVITPAMSVEDTAPSPGSNTPSLPVAGAIWRGSGIRPSCRISTHFTNPLLRTANDLHRDQEQGPPEVCG